MPRFFRLPSGRSSFPAFFIAIGFATTLLAPLNFGVMGPQATLFAQTPTPEELDSPASPPLGSHIGVRLDCLHNFNTDKGAAQECLTISGLRFSHQQKLSDQVSATFRLDPFAALPANKAITPLRSNVPTIRDTDLLLIDDFALIWLPRPNLEIAAESYEGSAHIPEVSGLALANPYSDSGWRQTAVTVTYNLSTLADMRVRFAAGNGEGEIDRNLDPQQYFGFEFSAAVLRGLHANIGISFDGNNVGSEEYLWQTRQYQDHCGFDQAAGGAKLGYSTQRLAGSLLLDGTLPAARGLKVGLGWQRNVSSDLDKDRKGGPKLSDLTSCATLDPDTVFVEAADGEAVNTVQRTVYDASVSYELYDGVTLGADYSTRRIDTGSVKLFETCGGYTGATCSAPTGSTFNNLAQSSMTFGGGLRLTEGLLLTLEYNVTSYDRQYTQFFYSDQNSKTSDTQEIFNARLAYNWR